MKFLSAETDFAFAAPAPFAFTRGYLSDRTRIGCLGRVWSIPAEGLGLEIGEEATVPIDAQGRRITFGAFALAPGQARFPSGEWL